jgi:hypothetical protein
LLPLTLAVEGCSSSQWLPVTLNLAPGIPRDELAFVQIPRDVPRIVAVDPRIYRLDDNPVEETSPLNRGNLTLEIAPGNHHVDVGVSDTRIQPGYFGPETMHATVMCSITFAADSGSIYTLSRDVEGSWFPPPADPYGRYVIREHGGEGREWRCVPKVSSR